MDKFLFGILVAFAFLSRWNYSDKPLWIDEAKYAVELVDNADYEYRELVPLFISKIIPTHPEWVLRLPFILLSTLTVGMLWFIVQDRRAMWIIALMMTFAPIFVWWGAMARPYTIALFFIVLGWRWPLFYIPAIFTTPFALAGLNMWKIRERFPYYIFLIVMGIIYYYSQQLSELNHFNLEYLIHAKRLWLVVIGSAMLHCADFNLERLQRLFKSNKQLA